MLDTRIVTYLTVIKKGSFTQAAKEEYRSSVAIMNQITSLENELGVQLLIRTHRGVKPTLAGKKLFDGAQELQENAEELTKKVKQLATSSYKIIRVGTSLLRPSNRLVQSWLSNAKEQNNFELQLVPFIDKSTKDVNQILSDDIDCIVTPYGITKWNNNYNYLPLGVSDCQIGVTKGNPLYHHKTLNWSDLDRQEIFLLRQGESALVDKIRKQIIISNYKIKILDLPQLYDIDILNQVVREKALVELPAFWSNIHPEIKLLPMDWSYRISYGLLYHKYPSAIMQKFIATISSIHSNQK